MSLEIPELSLIQGLLIAFFTGMLVCRLFYHSEIERGKLKK